MVEEDAPGAPTATAIELHGATLAEIAAVAGVDLATPLDVGHDTSAVGDTRATLTVDADAARLLAEWLDRTAGALDRVVASSPAAAAPTPVRLWPEHFDVAIDAAAVNGVRANLGGSVGDGFHHAPYLYVGPWTDARPGGGNFWNAPFGALLSADEVPDIDAAVAFFTEGLRRLTS